MLIKFKVLDVNENENSFVVRFFTNSITEDDLAVDALTGVVQRGEDGCPLRCRTDYNITVYKFPVPTGVELEDYIIRNAPVDFFKLLDAINDPTINTSMDPLKNLKGIVVEKEYVIPVVNSEEITEAEINQMIDEIV